MERYSVGGRCGSRHVGFESQEPLRATALLSVAALLMLVVPVLVHARSDEPLPVAAKQSIEALLRAKARRTPAQRKVSSQLLDARRAQVRELPGPSSAVRADVVRNRDTEGVLAHQADVARSTYEVDGTGIGKIETGGMNLRSQFGDRHLPVRPSSVRPAGWLLGARPRPGAAFGDRPGLGRRGAKVVRGPYLQSGTPSSVIIKWRTDEATESVVRYGLDPDGLTLSATNSTSTTEHAVQLTGLSADVKVFYAVGTSSVTLAGGDSDHFVVTAPVPGTAKPTRIWVIGDSGKADENARAVRDAFLNFTGSRDPDLWIMLGDNAYSEGNDVEYQAAVFDTYPQVLPRTVLWPTLGNHDGFTADSTTESGPYYDIFSLPRNGEAGGVASGTEAYYSFDYGNMHFICLDSYETDRSADGAMMIWLEADLEANDKEWVIAFWHHSPYSKGERDSDTGRRSIALRQNAVPLLERYGVDLVLTGHSHSYERSYLIDGHYELSDTFTDAMKKNPGDGSATGDGAYRKPVAVGAPRAGAVYVVAGTAGSARWGPLNHPAMAVSINKTLGSMVLDVNGSRLDAMFLDSTGNIRDDFTILKVLGTVPTFNSLATHPTKDPFTVTISFSEPVTGLTGSEVEVANGAGSNFSGSGATYRLRMTPDADFDGDVTVTVPAGAAEGSSMIPNEAGSATFAVDTLAPALAAANGAAASGATLTLRFGEALGAANVATSAFTVTGATTRSVTGVSVTGSTVRLTLSVPVLHGETGIEVDYDPPSREPIVDAVGNTAAAIEDRAVTNDTPATTLSTAVRLTMNEARVAEAGPARTVTVTGTLDRAGRPGATAVTIEVGAGTDTATEGTDYAAVDDLTLTIPAYATSGTARFTLSPTNDRTAEGTEIISVRGSVAGLTVTPTELALADDDEPSTRLDLSLNPSTVSEAAAPTEVAVTASLDAGARTTDTVVTVTVGAPGDSATEGLDYAFVSALAITVPANATTGRTMFTLSPYNDAIAEGMETITVSGRASGLTVAPVTLTLSDNDTASRIVTLAVDPASVTEDTPEDVTVTASLDAGARAEDTAVRLTVGAAGDTAVPGTDYGRVPERTLTILSGETIGTATFRLEPLDNDSADGARTLSVTGSTTVAELRIEPASGARIALDDDDNPALLVVPDTLTVVEAASDVYTVALQTRPTAQVTVTITGVSGDLSLDKTSLVFTQADWRNPQDVKVTAAADDDSLQDPEVMLTHVASGAPEYEGLRADLVVTIRENDPGLTLSETSFAVPEGGMATYTVALAIEPSGTVTVTVSGVSGDLSLDKTELYFGVGDWDAAQTVTVSAAEDDDTATDPAVTLTHRASGGGYDGIVGSVRVSVTENDGGGTGGGSGGGANRPPVVEREIDDRTLDVGEVLELDVRLNFYDRDQRALDYSVESADPSVATVAVDRNGVLTIRGVKRGVTAVTVTAADRRDERASDTFLVTVKGPALVALFPRAADPVREGFVRVINHDAEAGEVSIEAVDDTGVRLGPITLSVDAGATAHFNSGDLEDGNAAKGLPTGVGSGEGDWRLVLDSDLDFEALSYIRAGDGFLTSMHDVAPMRDGSYRVAILNPGSNPNQVSRLRLVNPGAEDAQVTITGIDDAGVSPGGSVTVTVPSGASRTIEAAGLEAGAEGFDGALGDGVGKWRLRVESEHPIIVMSLLSSPTGHLTNLSTVPDRGGN